MNPLQIHPKDNVAVALSDLPGIPAGHKVALRDIAAGEDVIKYGFPIGHATQSIARGTLVDHNNLATNLSGLLSYDDIEPEGTSNPIVQSSNSPTWEGYLRSDGQAGIRNELWVIPTVGCVDAICRQIVDRAKQELREGDGVDAIVAFSHNYGCSQLGDDHENTRRILADMVRHPNAGGVLVVGLGCENNQPEAFRQLCGDYDPERVRFMTCQEIKGDEVEEGVRLLTELHRHASEQKRQSLPLNLLRIGLKCGGSDGLSGITANPLLGVFSDWLCQQGGSTILTEVPEMFGAERLLMRRAVSREVLQQTILLINDFKQYYLSHGQPVGENPSPGNKAGGISTLEEKALGCTQKSGSSPVCGVLSYGQRLEECTESHGHGLHLLCAPGNDLVASTALAASGCQMVLFTTGRGTPFATFVPTLKVSTNTPLFQNKPHWMDFNAGSLVQDDNLTTLLPRFIQHILTIANGQPTRAEQAGIRDMAIWRGGVTL